MCLEHKLRWSGKSEKKKENYWTRSGSIEIRAVGVRCSTEQSEQRTTKNSKFATKLEQRKVRTSNGTGQLILSEPPNRPNSSFRANSANTKKLKIFRTRRMIETPTLRTLVDPRQGSPRS